MDALSPSSTDDTLKKDPRPTVVVDGEDIATMNGEHVEPAVKLLAVPFAAIVLLSTGLLVGFIAIFLSDVPMGSTISDPIGSSKNAAAKVDTYQLLNGYVSAAAGELLNFAFFVFLAVMATYMGNLPWHPGQNQRQGRSKTKNVVLWWFPALVMYVVNVGISSMNIKHTIVGVQHVFVEDDLTTSVLAPSETDASYNVQNTILRSAVGADVSSFTVLTDSWCLLPNSSSVDAHSLAVKVYETSSMPTFKSIDSTSVSYGFALNSWNYDALPEGADRTHWVNLTAGRLDADAFAAFQADTGFDFLTGYEMFLQGKTLFERAVSEANASSAYPCSWVDGKYEDDATDQSTFSMFPDTGNYANMRRCNGAVSSLPMLAAMSDASTHNLNTFVETVLEGMNTTLNQTTQLSLDETSFLFETYTISSQLNLTMLTLDIPLDPSVQYRDLSADCTSNGTASPDVFNTSTFTADQIARLSEAYCNTTYYVYSRPSATCGSSSCVFRDESGLVPFKRQILLLPYQKNCSVEDMTYGSNYLNFLPSGCEPEEDSAFLYGAGTYVSGDAFDEVNHLPFMVSPRRHLVFSFAKLDWQLEDVSKMFNAGCQVPGGCGGLVHRLQNASADTASVLVVGNSTIPSERMNASFVNPVQLVTLNAQPLVYPDTNERQMWEYVQTGRFLSVTWADEHLGALNCSVLIDSFIDQVESNHYYLDDPRQAMYTSALYYLFQDAATKTVTLGDASDGASSLYIGSTRLKGDMERKKIKFSVSLSSAIATFIGIAIVVGLSVVIVVTPIDRVKTSRETSFAARYATLLTDEEYPSEVHDCNLKLPGGELLPMEDCTVKSITLHSLADASEKVFL
jgi:hypothetical protein